MKITGPVELVCVYRTGSLGTAGNEAWKESIDFLISISIFAQHFSCVMCWTVILTGNEQDLQFRDIKWLIQCICNLYKT